MQYAKAFSFSGAGTQTANLTLPKRLYQQALLEVIVVEAGSTSPTFGVDFGFDSQNSWSYTLADWSGPSISYSADVSADMNAYMNSLAVSSGSLVTVPVAVSLDTSV